MRGWMEYHARRKMMSIILSQHTCILRTRLNLGRSEERHAPLMSTLSSNVARNAPSGFASAFLTCPRMPDTVRMFAPSNLATSSALPNMSFTNAVFLKILYGVPVSLSFFTI